MENTAGRYRERISRPSFSAASSSHAGHHAGNGSTAGHAFRSGTPAPALPETPIGKRCHGSERPALGKINNKTTIEIIKPPVTPITDGLQGLFLCPERVNHACKIL